MLPRRWHNLFLTLASYVFYGWANPLFVVLLFISTVIDYVCGLVIARSSHPFTFGPIVLLHKDEPRTRVQYIALITTLSSNLLILAFFKYFNFGIESYTALMNTLGLENLRLDLAFKVTLPLGISFYTFQSMSYAVDVYRGEAKAIRNFSDYACFVAMFPQLVAGPIIRFAEVSAQLIQRELSMEKFARGAAFMCMGLAKKVLLANPCGTIADTVFDSAAIGTADSWYGVTAYAFQIYFDFSGYSDMAIGLGLMFGFTFPKNFDSPYRSRSITEFWRRWHISLSTWLRDYLYIPIGGNRLGPGRTYANLAIVMILGGLWHGAAWTFAIWGAIHGSMLMLERWRGKKSFYEKLPGPVRTAFTFVVVLFTWVFFRSSDLQLALTYCGHMLGYGAAPESALLIEAVILKPYYIITFGVSALVIWFGIQTWDWTRELTCGKALLALCLFLLSIVALTAQTYNPFIYFIF
jgi:alginate O-acetyltransferase complex protein AlgI